MLCIIWHFRLCPIVVRADHPAACIAVEKRPKGHVLVEGETAVDKVKRDADLLAAEDDEEEDDAEIGAAVQTNNHRSETRSMNIVQ